MTQNLMIALVLYKAVSFSYLKLLTFCLIDQLAVSFISRRRARKKPSEKATLHPETEENGAENMQLNNENSHKV